MTHSRVVDENNCEELSSGGAAGAFLSRCLSNSGSSFSHAYNILENHLEKLM
jgi:hypothetical protein